MLANKYKVGHPEFLDEAKRLGLTGYRYRQKLVIEGILVDPTDVERKRVENLSRKMGYSSNAERAKEKSWNRCASFPMSGNEECSSYLGIHVVERILSKLFEDPIRMPYGNHGFDFICRKGFKIDYKGAVLTNGRIRWQFHIGHNGIADYFILVAFDNREDLNPMHIWLIKKDEMVRKGTKNGGFTMEVLYNRETINIYNDIESPMSFIHFQRYEVIDKLERLVVCCDKLKECA